MQRLRWVLIGIAVGCLSSAAFAFQESKGGVAAGQQPSQVSPGLPGGQLDLKDTGTSVATQSGGVEVRIPGLGKLGVLPKFDFGLELLYGANDAKTGDAELRGQPVPADDMQIRGSLKHRF